MVWKNTKTWIASSTWTKAHDKSWKSLILNFVFFQNNLFPGKRKGGPAENTYFSRKIKNEKLWFPSGKWPKNQKIYKKTLFFCGIPPLEHGGGVLETFHMKILIWEPQLHEERRRTSPYGAVRPPHAISLVLGHYLELSEPQNDRIHANYHGGRTAAYGGVRWTLILFKTYS